VLELGAWGPRGRTHGTEGRIKMGLGIGARWDWRFGSMGLMGLEVAAARW